MTKLPEFTPEQINEALTTVDDWHAGGHCAGGHTPACALAAGLRQERLNTTRKAGVLAAVTALLDQLKRDGLLVANEDVVRNLTVALAFDSYEESAAPEAAELFDDEPNERLREAAQRRHALLEQDEVIEPCATTWCVTHDGEVPA